MKMLILFSKICLFLFLKENMLKSPVKTKTTQPIIINGKLPKASTSCDVTNRNTAAKTASAINIVCILCTIF